MARPLLAAGMPTPAFDTPATPHDKGPTRVSARQV